MADGGAMIIHKVKARKGNKQTKKLMTTVPNIITTCFRYFNRLFAGPRLIAGLAIKCLAITVYKMIRINRGIMKKTIIDVKKKLIGQIVFAGVWQTGNIVPKSSFSRMYLVIGSIGLKQLNHRNSSHLLFNA